MEKLQDDELEIDLGAILYQLKQKWWLILLAAVVGAGIVGSYCKFLVVPQYTSTTMMYVLSKDTTLTSLADLQIGSQLTKDYSLIITSHSVLDEVIDTMGLDVEYKELREKLSIDNPTDTRMLSLSVTDADPYLAKELVDEIAATASDYIGEIMEMTPPKIIDEGEIPTVKTTPNTKKNTMLGALAGAFVVCGILTLMVILNDSIKTEEDVEKYLGLPVLATVPMRGAVEKISRSKAKGKRKEGEQNERNS